MPIAETYIETELTHIEVNPNLELTHLKNRTQKTATILTAALITADLLNLAWKNVGWLFVKQLHLCAWIVTSELKFLIVN